MTQIIEWLNQHNINAVKTIGTVAILLLASIVIPRLSRSFKQWLIHLESRLNVTDKTNSIINRVIIQLFGPLLASSFSIFGALALAASGRS
jgi:hypothetical protein